MSEIPHDDLDFAPVEWVVEYNIRRWQAFGNNPDMMNGETEIQYHDRLNSHWDLCPSQFERDLEEKKKKYWGRGNHDQT